MNVEGPGLRPGAFSRTGSNEHGVWRVTDASGAPEESMVERGSDRFGVVRRQPPVAFTSVPRYSSITAGSDSSSRPVPV